MFYAPAVMSCAAAPSAWSGRLAAATLILSVVLGVFWSWQAKGSALESAADGGGHASALFDQEHAAWTRLLRLYVRNGFVDYAGLKRDGQADLNAYLHALESVGRADFDSWNREQQLGYWINAYNAYTVRLILDHYPVKSIRSIGLLPLAAFRHRFIPLQGLRGKALSLNDIENEILRKEFQEPRIHFAIVCASKSCPSLRSDAYRGPDLEQQLDDSARAFIRDGRKNRFDAGSRTLYLSSIFKWFREDFERSAKTVPEFVARYADDSTANALHAGDIRQEFLAYDWSLNGR
jgi:hypothetical protein